MNEEYLFHGILRSNLKEQSTAATTEMNLKTHRAKGKK